MTAAGAGNGNTTCLRVSLVFGLLLALGASACRGRQGPPITRIELRRQHTVHVVQKGESAWGIARMYKVSLKDLVALNELDDAASLHPGDQLLIPGPKQVGMQASLPKAPAPPPPPTPKAPNLDVDPRPQTRTCEKVDTWLQPPDAVTKKGFSWPVDGVVITKYGKQDGLPYEGIAIAAPVGTPVRAASVGKVLFAGVQGGFGNLVLLSHADNRVSVYAHNHVNCVKAGQSVARGELLGLVGQSGGTQSPYLYFEIRDGKKTINPRVVLPR